MKELHNQFRPVSKCGDRLMEHEGNLLLWQYSTDGHDTTVPRIAVGKPPGHPDQYIIGQSHSIAEMAKAFNILDSLGYSYLRSMNVVINPYIYSDFASPERTRGEKALSELIRQFGVHFTFSDSRYPRGESDKHDLVSLGVKSDIRYPYFVSYDYTTTSPNYNKYNKLIRPILYAANVIHEWQHVLQRRSGLPSYSLWAERHAMSEQARFLEIILNSGNIHAREKESKRDIEDYMRYLATRILNYRNGTGFNDHSREDWLQGSPVVEQELHTEDYQLER